MVASVTPPQLDVPVREIVCSDFPEKIHMAKFGAFNEHIISVDGFGRIQKVFCAVCV